jgi:hypothetical protein
MYMIGAVLLSGVLIWMWMNGKGTADVVDAAKSALPFKITDEGHKSAMFSLYKANVDEKYPVVNSVQAASEVNQAQMLLEQTKHNESMQI